MTRQVVLDTETTGIDPKSGHKVIEIGCIELIDRKVTGESFHVYINPERQVDKGAFKVHGIGDDFLKDKPVFKDIVGPFLEFVKGAELIIHNAPFDIGFLNAELQHLSWDTDMHGYCRVFDTLEFAREKHPGQRNNLDALCKRYGVDNSNRELHGALLDADILASVYLAMTGGQTTLFTDDSLKSASTITAAKAETLSSESPVILATEAENAAHEAFVQFLVETSNVDLWGE